MNKKHFILGPLFFFLFALPKAVSAHCPLCTVGAAAAAAGAAYFGVKHAVIGLLIGAFAVSMGWWMSNLIKKQYIPYQRAVLIVASFALTIIPMMPLIGNITPVPVFFFGDYGTLFNTTYIVDMFLISAIIGGAVLCVTPWLSKKITHLRKGKMVPFQGMILTFGLLLILAVIMQVI